MNNNLLNQSGKTVQHFLKNIPIQEFYSGILTRARIATIYDKYYVPIAVQLSANPEAILRAIMIQAFRYINMKLQDITVLLVYGLNGLCRDDLGLTDTHLAQKLAMQNPDKNDIDIINRCIAQVMTKLPADLRERTPPLLRIQMIQKLNSDLAIMFRTERPLNQLSPASAAEPKDLISRAIIEGFQQQQQNRFALNNTNVAAPTSLDNNFLKEVEDVKASLGANTVKELEAQGYTPELLTKSSIDMRFDAGDYEQQLKALNTGTDKSQLGDFRSSIGTSRLEQETVKANIIPAKYYQEDPQLQMDAKTKELYYFDEYSVTLVPISDVQKLKGEEITTEKQLNTLLKEHNLSRKEIDKLLDELQGQPNTTTHRIKNTGIITAEEAEIQNHNKITQDVVFSEEIECVIL
jgi:hypothetical protein